MAKKLNTDVVARLIAAKLTQTASCVGCAYLYNHDRGYSNYTVEETVVDCALDLNKNLPADMPYNWIAGKKDNWPKTKDSRCMQYLELPEGVSPAHLDVDGDERLNDWGGPTEAKNAIFNKDGL